MVGTTLVQVGGPGMRRRKVRVVSKPRPLNRKFKRQVKRQIKALEETKMWDGVCATSDLAATGNSLLATASFGAGSLPPATSIIKQGTGDTDYLGKKITPVAFIVKYIFELNPTLGSDVQNTITIQLFQANGAFIPIQGSSSSQLTLNNTTLAPIGFSNLQFNNRLRVLKKRTITLDPGQAYVHSGQMVVKGRKLRNVFFNDAIGTVEANTIFISMVSDSGIAPHPLVRLSWRLYYKDA